MKKAVLILAFAAPFAPSAFAAGPYSTPPAPPTIVDSKGRFVGYALGQRPSYGDYVGFTGKPITIKAGNGWGNTYLKWDGSDFISEGDLAYLGAGCAGQAILSADRQYSIISDALIGRFSDGGASMGVAYADPSKQVQSLTPVSKRSATSGACTDLPPSLTKSSYVPALVVSSASLRWTPPFRLAPSIGRAPMDGGAPAPIFRNRSGAPYSKDTLGDDFREVRAMIFGEAERRTRGVERRRVG
jgi:hypothetical protein